MAGVQEAVRCWKSCEEVEKANQHIIQSSGIVCKKGKEVVKEGGGLHWFLNHLEKIMCLSLKATESVENFLEPAKNF